MTIQLNNNGFPLDQNLSSRIERQGVAQGDQLAKVKSGLCASSVSGGNAGLWKPAQEDAARRWMEGGTWQVGPKDGLAWEGGWIQDLALNPHPQPSQPYMGHPDLHKQFRLRRSE